MTCKHTLKPDAGYCSQCAGDPVLRVTLDGRDILLDGKPTGRQLDHERVITARKTRKR